MLLRIIPIHKLFDLNAVTQYELSFVGCVKAFVSLFHKNVEKVLIGSHGALISYLFI